MGFKKEGKRSFGGARKPFGKPGGRSFDGPRSFGKPSGPSGKPKFELFDVTCDRCGTQCQVPFRPTSGKPVYCKDCFNKGGDDRSSAESDELEQINKKLDKIM